MFVPAALRPSDLDALEPDHGPLRHYRVTLTNTYTGQSEVHEVQATSCAKAKARAEIQMSRALVADWGLDFETGDLEPKGVLHNDVVRLDA